MYLRLAWYLKALVFCSLIEQIELQYYSLSRALLLGVGGLPEKGVPCDLVCMMGACYFLTYFLLPTAWDRHHWDPTAIWDILGTPGTPHADLPVPRSVGFPFW